MSSDLQDLIRQELEKGGYYRKLQEENVPTTGQTAIDLEPAEDDFELYDDWDED